MAQKKLAFAKLEERFSFSDKQEIPPAGSHKLPLERLIVAFDVPALLKMSAADLDSIFSSSPAGEIPNGPAKGTAIVSAGTVFSPEIAEFINLFVWQGKTFDAGKGVLKNRILPLGLNAIIAKVYKGDSWLDRKECIVLDYSETSLVAHWIRDEIRLIGPDFYLGRVYWSNKPLIHFCLQFGVSEN